MKIDAIVLFFGMISLVFLYMVGFHQIDNGYNMGKWMEATGFDARDYTFLGEGKTADQMYMEGMLMMLFAFSVALPISFFAGYYYKRFQRKR